MTNEEAYDYLDDLVGDGMDDDKLENAIQIMLNWLDDLSYKNDELLDEVEMLETTLNDLDNDLDWSDDQIESLRQDVKNLEEQIYDLEANLT